MASVIRDPKDFGAGTLYLGLGAAAILLARDYSMGSALRMGPAYFPTVLGGLLVLLGVAALLRSFVATGTAIEPFAWRQLLLVAAAVSLFGMLLAGAGLIVSTVVLVLIAAYASMKFRWGWAVLLAAGLTAFSVFVFVEALGFPLPIVGSWLGG